MNTVVETRDGATDEFKRHHDVTQRRAGGDRICPKLEQMLLRSHISPAQSEAGLRWTRDYLVCFGGGGRSCLDISPHGVSGWNPSEQREDASRAYHAAKAALDGKVRRRTVLDLTPSDVVNLLCVDDLGFTRIGERLGMSAHLAQQTVERHLQTLADHYAREDTRRDATAQTREAALNKFEPELADKR